jgi:hypothetical protein
MRTHHEKSDGLGREAGAGLGLVPGAVLGAAAAVTALVRRDRALHPEGVAGAGRLEVTAPRPDLGVPLLAERGPRSCVARWSRAAGLPDSWPDVEGMALRFHDDGELLLAATGTGRVGRFLLRPRVAGRFGTLGTLLPVATDLGPTLFALIPAKESEDGPPSRYDFLVAVATGDWSEVGHLDVDWGPDLDDRFDPVAHPVQGTRQYAVVSTLRRPAYRSAQAAARARPQRQ